jgi:outer membrane protein TolC
VPHDQYKVGLVVEQLISDGGMIAAQQAMASASTAVAMQEAEVAAYSLREQVEAAFFGILLADAQIASLGSYHQDVVARISDAKALVNRGVATLANVNMLSAELIRIQQEELSAKSRRRAALDVLGILTGQEFDNDALLSMPVESRALGSRPESHLFSLVRTQLDRKAEVARRQTRPKIQAFGEVAAGRPAGLNLFDDRVQPFFSAGVRMNWPVWDWRRAEREREAISNQSGIVALQEEAFDQSIRAASARARRDAEHYEGLLDWDAKVIELRESIVAEVESRLANGVATASDYLIERNAEYQARLAARQHRILLAQAQARLKTVQGAQ